MRYVIQKDLLYVNSTKPWSKVEAGSVVEGIPFAKLSYVDKRHFLSIEKTAKKKDFNARLFAFEYEGLVRMAAIGRDGKPKREKR